MAAAVLEGVVEGAGDSPQGELPQFATTSLVPRPPQAFIACSMKSGRPGEAWVRGYCTTTPKFTSFRELSMLLYAEQTNNPCNIVSSIDLDKESEYFAVAGVTKKIKVIYRYCWVSSWLTLHVLFLRFLLQYWNVVQCRKWCARPN